jgi:hypothetical protein
MNSEHFDVVLNTAKEISRNKNILEHIANAKRGDMYSMVTSKSLGERTAEKMVKHLDNEDANAVLDLIEQRARQRLANIPFPSAPPNENGMPVNPAELGV